MHNIHRNRFRLPESILWASPINNDDYLEKLRLSLISGLPNEVDFAANALLIRSADSSSPLILNECHASLLDSLSGAVGVFGKRKLLFLKTA